MWYSLSCPDRLLRWRDWRRELDNMTAEAALAEIASTWMRVPRVAHYLSPDEIQRWPTPWELVNDNHYCDLSVCLGMFYTICLSKHRRLDPEMVIYKDASEHSWYHLCQIPQLKYVLNWDQGRIVNTPTLPSSARLIHRYKEIDLALQLG